LILIKTKKDIDFIRESCKIVAETLQLVKSNVKPGVTTLELDQIAEDYILSNNAIPAFKGYKQIGTPAFPGTLCTSIDEEVVHGIPSNRVLKDGEIISVDVGVKKNRYYGDAAITIAVGNISEEKKLLMKITENSLYYGLEHFKVGNRLGDYSNAVQNYVEENGFSVVKALCEHGVGKKLHEDPQIPNYGRKGTGSKIKNGMTLALEPMVNAGTFEVEVGSDNWTVLTADKMPSAHFEHTIAIINDKLEILTVC
jgi:methionyl aminopeptidase